MIRFNFSGSIYHMTLSVNYVPFVCELVEIKDLTAWEKLFRWVQVDDDNENQQALLVKELARAKGLEVCFIQKMDFVAGKFATVVAQGGGDCKNCKRY